MRSFRLAFAGLVLAQTLHSIEEYRGRLWESFPPARFVAGLISQDLERGFLIANIALVSFGLLCLAGPVRRDSPSAIALAWGWTTVELINGTGHILWTLGQGGYTPGVATAPLLLLAAGMLIYRLGTPAGRRTGAPDRSGVIGG